MDERDTSSALRILLWRTESALDDEPDAILSGFEQALCAALGSPASSAAIEGGGYDDATHRLPVEVEELDEAHFTEPQIVALLLERGLKLAASGATARAQCVLEWVRSVVSDVRLVDFLSGLVLPRPTAGDQLAPRLQQMDTAADELGRVLHALAACAADAPAALQELRTLQAELHDADVQELVSEALRELQDSSDISRLEEDFLAHVTEAQ